MIVNRIQDATGSHIEPPLDEAWPELTKLEWNAAVVAHDTGLTVHVSDGARLDSSGCPIPGWYSVNVGSSSIAAYEFRAAWTYLTGVSVGAEQAARA